MNRNVTETDNRDEHNTVLTLDNGDKVTIDPVKLFCNMIENLSTDPDADRSIIDEIRDFLKEHE